MLDFCNCTAFYSCGQFFCGSGSNFLALLGSESRFFKIDKLSSLLMPQKFCLNLPSRTASLRGLYFTLLLKWYPGGDREGNIYKYVFLKLFLKDVLLNHIFCYFYLFDPYKHSKCRSGNKRGKQSIWSSFLVMKPNINVVF